MSELRPKRLRYGTAGLLDVAYIFAALTTNGRLSWPAEAGEILALCRDVDSRVLGALCQHIYTKAMPHFVCCARTRLAHAASIGDDARVAVLLSLGAQDMRAACSPLARAISRGHTAAARRLLAFGADVPRCLEHLTYISYDFPSLSDSCIIARSVLMKELCADPSSGISAMSALELGVRYAIPSLVALHVDGAEAIYDANDLEWECWLLERSWSSPAMKANMLLLAARPSLFVHIDWFEIAADLGDQRLVRDLCALVPIVNESKALFAACSVGDLALVNSLLARDGHARGDYFPPGARQDIVLFFPGRAPWWGHRPSLFAAAQRGHVDVVRCILHWLRVHPDHAIPDQSLMAAVGCGLMLEAAELVREGADLNLEPQSTPHAHDSYLCVACACADVGMVRMLLGEGADPNLTFFQDRPLFCAALMEPKYRYSYWGPMSTLSAEDELICREQIVRLLLDAGASLGPQPPGDWRDEAYAPVRALITRVSSAEERIRAQ